MTNSDLYPRLIFAGVFAALFSYGTYWDVFEMDAVLKAEPKYGWRWKYLTFWDLVAQTIYWNIVFFITLLDIAVGERRHWRHPTLSFLHHSILTPIGIFVSVTFWALYHFDKPLIWPANLDDIIPWWMNQIWHTAPAVATLLEKLFTDHKVINRRVGLSVTFFFSLVYLAWVFHIAHVAKIWVYPILEVLPFHYRALFITGCLVANYFFYRFGEFVSVAIWNRRRQKTI